MFFLNNLVINSRKEYNILFIQIWQVHRIFVYILGINNIVFNVFFTIFHKFEEIYCILLS
jgi:hypothetical protein